MSSPTATTAQGERAQQLLMNGVAAPLRGSHDIDGEVRANPDTVAAAETRGVGHPMVSPAADATAALIGVRGDGPRAPNLQTDAGRSGPVGPGHPQGVVVTEVRSEGSLQGQGAGGVFSGVLRAVQTLPAAVEGLVSRTSSNRGIPGTPGLRDSVEYASVTSAAETGPQPRAAVTRQPEAPLFDDHALERLRRMQEGAPLLYQGGLPASPSPPRPPSTSSSDVQAEVRRQLMELMAVRDEESRIVDDPNARESSYPVSQRDIYNPNSPLGHSPESSLAFADWLHATKPALADVSDSSEELWPEPTPELGTLMERELGLKHISDPPAGTTVQVRALTKATKVVVSQNPEMAFRINLARAALQVDMTPDDDKVKKLHAQMLSELEAVPKGNPKSPPVPKVPATEAGSCSKPYRRHRRAQREGTASDTGNAGDFGETVVNAELKGWGNSLESLAGDQDKLRALVKDCEVRMCNSQAAAMASAVALLDSGATHAVIPYDTGLTNLEPVPVTLAGDARQEWLKTAGGTLVVPPDPGSGLDKSPAQVILPLGALVESLGCQITWSKGKGLRVIHPVLGRLDTGVSRNTCPYVQEQQALQLISELEEVRLRDFRDQIQTLECQLDAYAKPPDPTEALQAFIRTRTRREALAALIAQPYLQSVPDEVKALLAEDIPEGTLDDGKAVRKDLPLKRAARRDLLASDKWVVHLCSGKKRPGDPIAKWCQEKGMPLVHADVLEKGGKGWDLTKARGTWRALIWAASLGKIAVVLSSPPKYREGARQVLHLQDMFLWSLASVARGSGIPYLAEHAGLPDHVASSFRDWSGVTKVRLNQGALGDRYLRPTEVDTNLDLRFLEELGVQGEDRMVSSEGSIKDEEAEALLRAFEAESVVSSDDEGDPLENVEGSEAQVQRVNDPSPAEVERWKAHLQNGHVPYRRDCRQCIEGAGVGVQHRRVRHPQSYALSADLFGPVPSAEHGRDETCVSGRRNLKYALVGAFRIPRSAVEGDTKEAGVEDLFERARSADPLEDVGSEYAPSEPPPEVLDDFEDLNAPLRVPGTRVEPEASQEELLKELFEVPDADSCARAPYPFSVEAVQGTFQEEQSILVEDDVPQDPQALRELIKDLKEPVEQVVLRYVVPLKGKSGPEVAEGIQKMILSINARYPVRILHTDLGTEFISSQLSKWLAGQSIRMQHTLPTDKKANGLAERWVEARYAAPHSTIPDGHVLITDQSGSLDQEELEQLEAENGEGPSPLPPGAKSPDWVIVGYTPLGSAKLADDDWNELQRLETRTLLTESKGPWRMTYSQFAEHEWKRLTFMGVNEPEDLAYLFEEDLIEIAIYHLTETPQADPTESPMSQDHLEMMYLQSMWEAEEDTPVDSWPPAASSTDCTGLGDPSRSDGITHISGHWTECDDGEVASPPRVRRVDEAMFTPDVEGLLERLEGPLEVVHNVAPAEVRSHLEKWRQAATTEVQSLETMGAIRRLRGQEARGILRSGDVEIIPAKAVCTVKPGSPFKRKVRVVSCGNFASTTEETLLYAGGAGAETLRALLAHNGRRGRRCHSLDVKSAFLLAPIPAYVKKRYAVRPPKLLTELGICAADEIWMIERALYGFRESPRWWSVHRDSVLSTATWNTERGALRLRQLASDSNVWSIELESGECMGHLLIYVDDMLIMADDCIAASFFEWIRGRWDCTDLQTASCDKPLRFLGVDIYEERDEHGTIGFSLGQEGYIDELARSHSLKTNPRATTPIPKEWVRDAPPSEDYSPEQLREGQRITGELLWVAQRTRLDVAYSVGLMASLVARSPQYVVKLGTRVLEYLCNTKGHRLTLVPGKADGIRIYTDASFAPHGEHSITGNSVRIRAGFIKDMQSRGEATVSHCPGDLQLADALTKALPKARHELLAKLLGLGPPGMVVKRLQATVVTAEVSQVMPIEDGGTQTLAGDAVSVETRAAVQRGIGLWLFALALYSQLELGEAAEVDEEGAGEPVNLELSMVLMLLVMSVLFIWESAKHCATHCCPRRRDEECR
ncbi:TY5A, partial [Symbiodinium sp. CCMP2456]